MQRITATFFLVLLLSFSTHAQLVGTFPTGGGNLVLSTETNPVQFAALRLASSQGNLTPGSVLAPFQSRTSFSNSIEYFASSDVVVDGSITLDLAVSANAVVQGWHQQRRGERGERIAFPISAGETTPFPFFATRPFSGGPITIAPFAGSAAAPLTGIQLNAASGELTSGGSAAPFESLESNTSESWSAASTAAVFIDGPIELDVVASSNSSISGQFSSGSATGEFAVNSLPPPTDTQIVGRYSIDGGPISVQSTQPVSIRQLQLNSSGGNLIGGTNAAPFENIVSNTDTEWSVSSNAAVVLNGSVDLDVQVEPNTFVKGFTNDGVATSAFQLYALSEEDLDAELFGIFPEEGGLLTVVTTKGPILAGGLHFDVNSPSDITVTEVPAPFAFFIPSSNPLDVTLGVLGAPVELNGPVTLGIEVSANAIINTAQWGQSVVPTDFPVVGGLLQTGLTREPDRLAGTYSLAGGPVSIQATGDPVPLRELELVAANGSLIDQDSAAPFESVTTSGTSWTAQSSVDVMIDGEIVLGVEVAPFSLVRGIGTTSDDTFAFSLNSFTEDVIASELVAVFPEGGGKVTVFATEEPITTDTLEFATDDIGAITAGFDPAPFDFFLADPNKPNSIILGMNEGSVTISSSLTLDITASPDAEFFGTWGEGVLTTFPAIAVPNVPEPNGQFLVTLGTLGMLTLRRRKYCSS